MNYVQGRIYHRQQVGGGQQGHVKSLGGNEARCESDVTCMLLEPLPMYTAVNVSASNPRDKLIRKIEH